MFPLALLWRTTPPFSEQFYSGRDWCEREVTTAEMTSSALYVSSFCSLSTNTYNILMWLWKPPLHEYVWSCKMVMYFTLERDPRRSLEVMANGTLPEVRVAFFDVSLWELGLWHTEKQIIIRNKKGKTQRMRSMKLKKIMQNPSVVISSLSWPIASVSCSLELDVLLAHGFTCTLHTCLHCPCLQQCHFTFCQWFSPLWSYLWPLLPCVQSWILPFWFTVTHSGFRMIFSSFICLRISYSHCS